MDKYCIPLKLLVVLLASSINVSYGIPGRLIYDYESNVQVRKDNDSPFGSMYKIKAEVISDPTSGEHTYRRFQLRNIKYYVYDGDLQKKNENENVFKTAPAEASSLSEPFFVYFNEGLAKIVKFKSNEPEWSKNMKKALVNSFQVNLSRLRESYSFLSKENSIFGSCTIEYSSFPVGKKSRFVTKVYSTSHCEKPAVLSKYNAKSEHQESTAAEETNGIKKYILSDLLYGLIESLETTEKIYGFPLAGGRQSNFALIRQNITLMKMENTNISLEADFKNSNIYDTVTSLQYSQVDSQGQYGLFYFSNGRSSSSSSHLDVVFEKLEKGAAYLKENHLIDDIEKISHSPVINQLLISLRYLDLKYIEKIFNKVCSVSSADDVVKKNFFLQILPMIGTESSLSFIETLLKNKNNLITDNELLHILNIMPFYIVNYELRLLDKMQVLLKVADQFSHEIQDGAVLAYSILFGKVCTQKLCLYQLVQTVSEDFYNKINENKDNYKKQLVYVEGLKNLMTKDAANFLGKIISNKEISEDLRVRAIFGPKNPLLKNPSLLFKVCLPVLVDISEPADLRIAALSMIIEYHISHPDSSMYTYHWHMLAERSAHVYNYYYTLLQSYAKSTNPHHEAIKKVSQKLLKVSRKPSSHLRFGSFANIYNYIGKNNGNGYETVFNVIGAQGSLPNTLYGEWNLLYNDNVLNLVGVYIRIKGLQENILNCILKDVKSLLFVRTGLNNKEFDDPYHIEIILQKQGYTTSIIYQTEGNIAEIGLQQLMKLNKQFISFTHLGEKTIVTDIGVPLVVAIAHPSVTSVIGHVKFDDYIPHAVDINLDIRQWIDGHSNMAIFNPVSDTWHAITKSLSLDIQLPVNAKISLKKQTFEFTVAKKDGDGHIGIQASTRSYSSIRETDNPVPLSITLMKQDVLQKLSQSGSSASNRIIVLDYESLAYNVIMDTEKCGTNEENSNEADDNTYSEKPEDKNKPFYFVWMMLDKTTMRSSQSSDNCAIKVYASPTTTNAGSKFNIKIKVNGGEVGNHPLPGYKFNVLGDVELVGESEDKSRSYSFNSDVDSSPNGIKTLIKTKFSTAVGGVTQGTPFVIDFEKTFPPLGADSFKYGWGDESVTTKLSVSGQSEDSLSLSFDIVGTISEEQKKIASSDIYPYNQCEVDKKKSEWQGPLYPRTSACFESAIRLFYARQLKIGMKYNNIRIVNNLIDNLPSMFGGSVIENVNNDTTYAENYSGAVNITILHRVAKPTMEIEVLTADRYLKLIDVPSINRNIYQIQLDNTHFSRFIQLVESTGLVKSCVANSVSVLTSDNATVSHQFGSNFEILSKLEKSSKYSVSAKKGSNGLVAEIVVGDATVEISGNTATLNGKPIPDIENGFQYPPNEPYYYFRIRNSLGQITVYSKRIGFYVVYTPVSITLDQNILLRGLVSGLCGNLNDDPDDDFLIQM
ncbi:vitellogenin-6-like [Lycorma delicatula]|uniref:vitellogenin-6-like n=1 Tax=Lycorma delicatula TaxID=130591 RepID=UPI003F519CC8